MLSALDQISKEGLRLVRTTDIRKQFIEFFRQKSHTVVESSSLVPDNDPTLLFTNAGMNQFKDVFLGKEKRDYVRAVSSQKCVRAGGKHNDLENVGFTARHHTFFEMLGNFSFGDYFKQDAIEFAWEFVTQVLKLPKDRLYVTVFRDDDEAARIWHEQQKVPLERIYRMGEKDNFWQMGDTGPCGPCSEIFVDRGEMDCPYSAKTGKRCEVGCDCDRFMEIWNLVFMQFNRTADGKLHPLPKPSVDTGAGLERLASVLQNVSTNYETDAFKDIIENTAKLAGISYDPNARLAASFRVIADHARAVTFLIADGVLPSNEGRGYVLRRILRRAIRHGQLLGFSEPFLYKVCGFVIEQMCDAYPYLTAQKSLIDKCVAAEEEQFLRTLTKGLELLDAELSKLKKGGTLAGDIAFKLYDTYGFPLDLTKTICVERQCDVDEVGFAQAMEEQKARSREHWKGGSAETGVKADYHEISAQLKSLGKLPVFVGYDSLTVTSECVAVLNEHDGHVEAVFAKTPFYGESGGQVGDRGRVAGAGFSGEVVDVQRPLPELIVCKIKIDQGALKVGASYEQIVDHDLRELTKRNHTATHLLHWALRQLLGTHVKQAGSLVTPELLRFDFTHFQGLSKDELDSIEQLINEQIWTSHQVTKQEMAKDDAIAAGAVAMFGEKYGERVRVVSVGDISVELCGGTHVDSSSEINMFKIASESGIAAGVRRIIAYTSEGAFNLLNERYNESKQVRDRLKANSTDEVLQRLDRFAATEKELRRSIEQLKAQGQTGIVDSLLKSAVVCGSAKVVATTIEASADGVKALRDLGESLKQKSPQIVAVLGMTQPEDGKVFVLSVVGKDLQTAISAGDIIKVAAPIIEGRGGGKAEMAQAGGTKVEALNAALEAAKNFITKTFS